MSRRCDRRDRPVPGLRGERGRGWKQCRIMDEFRLEVGRKVTAGGVDGRGFTLTKQHALFEIDATVAVVTFLNTTVLVDCKV
jgi:hypothetical protein